MSSIKHKKIDSERIDDESPEWTDEMFARARSLEESALPETFKRAVRRGYPKEPKTAVTV
ncbi:MAG: hypothetical protein ACPW60_03245 [Methylohalobius sp. ZOD2]